MQVPRLVQRVLKSILKHLSVAAVASAATGITMFLMFNILNGNSFGGSHNMIVNGDQSGNKTKSTHIEIGKIEIDKSVKIIDQSITNIDKSITELNNSITIIQEEARHLSIDYPKFAGSSSFTTISKETERITDQTTNIKQMLPDINRQITTINKQTDNINLLLSGTNVPSSSNKSVVGNSPIDSPTQSANAAGDDSSSSFADKNFSEKGVGKKALSTEIPEPSSMIGTLLVTPFVIFSWFKYARVSRK